VPSCTRFRHPERDRTGGHGDRMELSVPLPRTPNAKVIRACPDETCVPGVFQRGDAVEPGPDEPVHRRVRQPRTPGTTCPYCGTAADDGDFISPEHVQAALREVEWAVGRQPPDALRARRFGAYEGERELAFRLLGKAHEEVLTAFETYLKPAHRPLARKAGVANRAAKPAKTNRF
jgi:hypothetical protein